MKTAAALYYLAGDRAGGLRQLLARAERGGASARQAKRAAKRVVKAAPTMTLRDVRRIASRHPERWDEVTFGLGVETMADLDRLISRFGPDAEANALCDRLQAERTDHIIDDDFAEVDEGENQDAPTHGGDGNSGECNHAAETATAERQSVSDTACPAGGAGDTPDHTSVGQGSNALGNEGAETDHADAARGDATGAMPNGAPTCEGDDGGDEPTGEMGTQPSDGRSDGDNPSTATGGLSAEAGACCRQDGSCERGMPAGDADSPSGQAAGLTLRGIVQDAVQRQAATRLVAALRRVVEKTCAMRGAASHRIDGKVLIRELVSRRYAINRARRAELDVRDIVIAVDVSRSCSSTVAATFSAAMMAAALLPRERISVMTHSNGLCVDGVRGFTATWLDKAIRDNEDGLDRDYFSARQREASDAVWDAVINKRPGLVIVLGDMDSHHVHEKLAEAGIKVLLMTWIGDEHIKEADVDYPVIPGVIDTITAADGLEAAIKERLI